ncbi:MAG TPA: hypothetical protein VIL49_15260 [Capillimicrobium sp.]
MSRNQRFALLALAVVVLVVGFVVARSAGDDDEPSQSASVPAAAQTQPPEPAEPADGAGSEAGAEAEATEEEEADEAQPSEPAEEAPPLIRTEGGQPVGGVEELSYALGDEVDFRVRSDVDEELHVHGYEIVEPLPAGKAVRVRFPADIDGRFEIELHGAGSQIAELEVQP